MRRDRLALDDALDKMSAAESLMASREYPVHSRDVLSLAASSGCTAYDCEFVALAQDKGIPLVTSDRAILASFKRVALAPEDFCAR